VSRPGWFPGGYNSVMMHFADLDQELARKAGATFVNFNPPVVAVMQRALALDPLMAKLILPDRVHPDPLAHWVMAAALLKGWNAPALVSSLTIDALAVKAEAQNAIVGPIQRDKDTLKWTTTELSLPLPLIADNHSQALLLQLTDIQQQLNQESLAVTGLDPGSYELLIDGKSLRTFSAAELAKGINLADYQTPMRAQAQRVGWMVRDRDQAHYIHMRMEIKKADIGAQPGKPDVIGAFENLMEDEIYQEAAPKPHEFLLRPASAPLN
jgi:hypothetical protein